MSLTDWFNFVVAIGTVSLAGVASVYVRLKAKSDTKTAAGKAFDVLGKLAVWAVNEAEHSQDGGQAKREYAAEVITEQLHKKGITDITESTVYGAIQAAWSAANFDHAEKAEAKEPEAIQDAGDAGQVMDDAPVAAQVMNDAPVAAKEGEANVN